MKKSILGLVVASVLASNAHAAELTLEQASAQIMTKMEELATLAAVEENVVEEGDYRYLKYKGKQLRINYDGNVMFDLFDIESEFETVFDFIPKHWDYWGYAGGFDLFPEGYENTEVNAEKCTFALYAAARGSKDNQGNYVWERPLTTNLDASECPSIVQKPSIFFNTNQLGNMLTGELSGAVLFAQAHIVPGKSVSDEKRMHLVGERKTKVMFKPDVAFEARSLVMLTAKDKQGVVLGSLDMNAPDLLARNVLAIPEIANQEIDFSYDESAIFSVREVSSAAIAAALVDHDVVKLNTWNGHWIRDFALEQNNPELNGKTVIFQSSAGYNSNVSYYQDRVRTIVNGSTTVFKNVNGAWVLEDDLIFNDIGYADGYWSADLPRAWLAPGLSLTLSNEGKSGDLTGIKVGAPTELLMHTIDVGMLVEPRGRFDFQTDKQAQQEYFETAPLSKMIVSEYEPVHLVEVMLSDGTLLTDHDPSDGGWHGGTMRQRIGKELFSIGINNANYGIHSTAGVGEGENPYLAAQLTAHNARGLYANGVQMHGGSGGAGMVTLDSSIGNEFSHEVGHNYGLGHYPGGFEGSIHKPANMSNSTWGWDSSRDVFIPNFAPQKNGVESCLDGQCVPAFNDMFSFGSDAMAGGWAMYNQQRFTMYTPYSMSFIQKNLESKAVFDQTSSTGFKKWNEATETMDEYTHRVEHLEVTTVAPWEANAEHIATLLANFDKVDLSTWNGHWARDMSVPAASRDNQGKVFTFNSDAGYSSNLTINGASMVVPYGSRLVFVSDGQTWVKGASFEQYQAIKPNQFGVPVTTLVGYYDPSKQLDSYIFPALHGSYGYVYADDSVNLATNCALEVEMANGDVDTYALKNNRRNADNMNKFHINVARADNPKTASVICDGEVLDTLTIAAPTLDPVYTVQGGDEQVKAFAMPVKSALPRVLATRYAPEKCDHPDGEHNH
ncbi:M66 family metalloprotease [Vibrio renipiscarius]|uniref:M66 family metalloprotease n=1 Tax=Vibrio renipiscarius TaxID=1461322 RepID=UPI003552B003